MDILGIGIPELIFILLIILVLLGPGEMQKSARSIGQGLRKFVMSDTWKVIRQTNRELQTLPNKLMRQAGITEAEEALRSAREIANPSTDLPDDIENIKPLRVIPSPEAPSGPIRAASREGDSAQDDARGEVPDA